MKTNEQVLSRTLPNLTAGFKRIGGRTWTGFFKKRSEHLTEEGIHLWFRTHKAGATKGQWELIHDLTFHDLQHDFAHHPREEGWSLEEVAYYLGHVTKKGTPAIQTTVR